MTPANPWITPRREIIVPTSNCSPEGSLPHGLARCAQIAAPAAFATISNSGTLEIFSGGSAGTSLITISSGTLILDQSQAFSGTVAGLATSGAQNIDLLNISSASLQPLSYTASGGSGTLTVTDGTITAQLNLIGAYTVGSFKISDDGHGGTLITDPPVSSGSGVAPPH